MINTGSFLPRAAAIAACCFVFSAGNALSGQEPATDPQQPETIYQEVKPRPPEVVSKEVDQKLWSRGREILHNGNPLDIVGLEEGDNGFRQRTPILEQSDRGVAIVDPDENYRRHLAMYTERGSYTEPVPLSSVVFPKSFLDSAESAARPSTPVEDAGGEGHPVALWIASTSLLLLLLLRWLVKQKAAWS